MQDQGVVECRWWVCGIISLAPDVSRVFAGPIDRSEQIELRREEVQAAGCSWHRPSAANHTIN